MKQALKYLFRGALLIVPIGMAIYVVFKLILLMDDILFSIPLLQKTFPVLKEIHGLGVIVILPTLTLIGYIVSNLMAKSFLDFVEGLVVKIPMIGFIYSSVKDLMQALVGDNRKFDKPVLVILSKESNIRKLGFVTNSDLTSLGMTGFVGVYLPHAYAFSGNLYIIPTDCITPLDAKGTDIYKMIVSGGVTGIDDDNKTQFLLEFERMKKKN